MSKFAGTTTGGKVSSSRRAVTRAHGKVTLHPTTKQSSNFQSKPAAKVHGPGQPGRKRLGRGPIVAGRGSK